MLVLHSIETLLRGGGGSGGSGGIFSHIALRTMNLGMMKIMQSACAGHKVYPLDDVGEESNGEVKAVINAVARELASNFGWPDSLHADSLVLHRCYPPGLVKIFRGGAKNIDWHSSGIEAPGNAERDEGGGKLASRANALLTEHSDGFSDALLLISAISPPPPSS